MATIKTNIALDMENHRGATQIVSATATEVTYTSGSLTSVYRGVGLVTFGDSIGYGTVTGFSEYVNRSLTLDVSGFSVSAVGVAPTITTGNIGMLFRSILGGNDVIYGSAFDDNLIGGAGKDTYYPGAGTNIIRDGSGQDVAVLTGQYKQYTVSGYLEGNTPFKTFAHQDGTSKTSVAGVARIQFDDGTLALDVSGNAGQAYRLYKAAFDRAPENDGLKFWIGTLDSGTTLRTVTQAFIDSAEFKTLYANAASSRDFVQKLYQTALHRTGDEAGVSFWASKLDDGMSKAQVLSYFAESAENVVGVSGQISDGIWYV